MKSFKSKLFIIFILPSLAFIYFSYLFIQSEYTVQNNISKYKYSIKLIVKISELVHNLQIERGLSAGYIVSNDKSIKKHLLKQYDATQMEYNKLLKLLKEKRIMHNISIENQNILFLVIDLLKNIESIRKFVIASSISFDKEIDYYSEINNKLILFIKNINSNFINLHHDDNTIDYFLQIQEYAGLERAYIYNFLLSHKNNSKIIWEIQELFKQRKKLEENLLLSASADSIDIYNRIYSKKIEEKVYYCSREILKGDYSKLSAEKCFHASTEYINMLNKIYESILNMYVKKADLIYSKSLNHLYIAFIVEAVSIIIILFLFYILFKLIKNEEKNKENLRIAAYTFEAQEGVVITNAQGEILKVNKSFTSITGYTAEEAIGNTPRVLKSDKHPKSFYSNIWKTLIEKGQWQGKIINKRKNGEFYNEMLSITSIKDEENVTTHYIAQFLDISEITEAQRLLKYQVDHDYLTGLLNRKALKERLNEEYSKSKRHNLIYAFLFIDLDNFKSINDNYGHAAGDKVIIEASKRMKSILREEDIVARISGDEFGIVLTNFQMDKEKVSNIVKHIAKKVLDEISKEIIIDNDSINISSSIGIKLFPDDNTTFEDIIIHADKAMYIAKEYGKNQFVFYDS